MSETKFTLSWWLRVTATLSLILTACTFFVTLMITNSLFPLIFLFVFGLFLGILLILGAKLGPVVITFANVLTLLLSLGVFIAALIHLL